MKKKLKFIEMTTVKVIISLINEDKSMNIRKRNNDVVEQLAINEKLQWIMELIKI